MKEEHLALLEETRGSDKNRATHYLNNGNMEALSIAQGRRSIMTEKQRIYNLPREILSQ